MADVGELVGGGDDPQPAGELHQLLDLRLPLLLVTEITVGPELNGPPYWETRFRIVLQIQLQRKS